MQLEPIVTEDSFSRLLGVQHGPSRFEEASCWLIVGSEHCNALGGIHGGVIFSLADIAFAAACNAADDTYIGMQAEVRYIRRAEGSELHATAKLVGASRKMAHYQVLVTNGQDNPVALFTSSAYKLGA